MYERSQPRPTLLNELRRPRDVRLVSKWTTTRCVKTRPSVFASTEVTLHLNSDYLRAGKLILKTEDQSTFCSILVEINEF